MGGAHVGRHADSAAGPTAERRYRSGVAEALGGASGRTVMETTPVGGAHLEVEDRGAGDPVVLVQTALVADEFLPIASQPPLRDGYRTLLYHRRGYAGSSPAVRPSSIVGDAEDCRALLAARRIERAHVVGLSYSGAVALQLAADAPDRVQSLTLIEPPPVHVRSAAEFRAANEGLLENRRTLGPDAALEAFLTLVIGPGWRRELDRGLPGAVEQVSRDAATFFDVDLPNLLAWRFTAADARRATCPVLYVGGTDSGPWFAEVRELLLGWLPQAEDVRIDGADHSLAITHPAQIAEALVAFLGRHPIDAAADQVTRSR